MQRAFLPALLLLGLHVPALAQTRPASDPWAGIVIVVTPEQEVEAGDAVAPDATEQAEGGQVADEQAFDAALALGDEAEAFAPSLFTVLDLGLGNIEDVPAPEPTPAQLIARQKRPQALSAAIALPTSVGLTQGPASLSLSSAVSTTAPLSSALTTKAGGGNGEVKGRVDYALDNLVIYGTGNAGAATSLGTVSLYNGLAVGTSYKMPLDALGIGAAGESVGARVEVADTAQVKTSVEMRSPLGHYERFIAVDRSVAPDATASGALRAGILGKF